MARLLDLLFAPLALLARLWPKGDGVLFGAWHGQRFADNSRALAEWLAEEGGRWRPVWIAHRAKAVLEARRAGLEAHHAWSPTGLLAHLRAPVAFVTHGRHDMNRFLLGASVVCLGHGMPIRRIGLDAARKGGIRGELRKLARRLPTHPHNFDSHLASSPKEAEFLREAHSCAITLFPQPRVLRAPPRRPAGGRLRVLALFTWRPWAPLHDLGQARALGAAGAAADITVKSHAYWARRRAFAGRELPNGVQWVSDPNADALTLLSRADLLVTDYSSVAVDAADLGVPVAFVRDLEYEARRPLYWEEADFDAVGIGRWETVEELAADLSTGGLARRVAAMPPPASLGPDAPARAGEWPPVGRLKDFLAAAGL